MNALLSFVALRACQFLLVSVALSEALAQINFKDVTTSAGISHLYSQDPDYLFYFPEYGWMAAGAVADDFNGDGWPDLFVTQGGASSDLLYINQGDGTFQNEAGARGTAIKGPHFGVSAADYDNDGDVDIFVTSALPPHKLLINDGTGHFEVRDFALGGPQVGCTGPSWGDINNDGLLDLVMGSWDVGETESVVLYRNIGNGNFALQQEIQNNYVFTPSFADLNNDGFQDLLLAADFGNTKWYFNRGDGTMQLAGSSDVENGMGSAVGDIDNDGDLDIFISSVRDLDGAELNWGTSGNRLHLNDGSGNFTDHTETAGVRDGYWGWGSAFADFDNDGNLDIYHVNGWQEGRQLVREEFNLTPAKVFRNLGNGTFEDVGSLAGDGENTGQGRAVVVFDYDLDGDQDLFIANGLSLEGTAEASSLAPGVPVLLRNDSQVGNHWMKVKAVGISETDHHHGIGCRVYLQSAGSTQMRELSASSGFNGHGLERIAHFGLGTSTAVDEVKVVWPDGHTVQSFGVPSNQLVEISGGLADRPVGHLESGELFELSVPSLNLEEGWTVEWIVDGFTYPNNTSLSFQSPGVYSIRARFFDPAFGSSPFRVETYEVVVGGAGTDPRSVAQIWNEQNLAAIRIDFPAPTKHARNLFLTSVAMWDAWAYYDATATGYLFHEKMEGVFDEEDREKAISFAAYRVLSELYDDSVGAVATQSSLNFQFEQLGYDQFETALKGATPAAIGNRIAFSVLAFASTDQSLEQAYQGGPYEASNEPMPVAGRGTSMNFPNRWQPLLFERAITQNGQLTESVQSFVGPNWGGVRPFSMPSQQAPVYYDPGPPPALGGESDSAFKHGNQAVIEYSSWLDPRDSVTVDISPGVYGNNPLGENSGTGRDLNPVTGQPYPPNIVKRADFGRVLAEFWADGPDSETPPGHWNTLANDLHEHPDFVRKFRGVGDELDRLEWDVKLYLVLNGALHDAAIAAWGCKRVYDYVRPVSSIRHMGGLGQSTDPSGPSYHPDGLPLVPGLIEVVSAETAAEGQRHEAFSDEIGSMVIYSWRDAPERGGVDWILAENWLPYQRATFVTPAFPGYVSGHSTFSRAAAEVLTEFTGSEFFPGGMGTFTARKNEFLEFDEGPTSDVELQWATYYDAADQAGISRLYGGIHVPADDGPGRVIGSQVGEGAWEIAQKYYDGSIKEESFSSRLQLLPDGRSLLQWDSVRGAWFQVQAANVLEEGAFTPITGWIKSGETSEFLDIGDWVDNSPRGFFRVERRFENP